MLEINTISKILNLENIIYENMKFENILIIFT